MTYTQRGSFGDLDEPISPSADGIEMISGHSLSGQMRINIPYDCINDDNRIKIQDTRSYPYRWICYLKISYREGFETTGTGWLVGPRTVITAGHCIYDERYGGLALKVELVPGANGHDQIPYGRLFSDQFDYVITKDKSADPGLDGGYDIGAISLADDCCNGRDLGYFGFGVFDQCDKKVYIAGYPDDKDDGGLWCHQAKIFMPLSTRLHYQIDTEDGQSGSPIWYVDDDGDCIVVGIHNGGKTKANPNNNYGTRFDDYIYSKILEWRDRGF